MSKIDNIERLRHMKELSKLKAELHKRNAMNYLSLNIDNQSEETVQKVIRYCEIGFSVFQIIRSVTKNEHDETEGTEA